MAKFDIDFHKLDQDLQDALLNRFKRSLKMQDNLDLPVILNSFGMLVNGYVMQQMYSSSASSIIHIQDISADYIGDCENSAGFYRSATVNATEFEVITSGTILATTNSATTTPPSADKSCLHSATTTEKNINNNNNSNQNNKQKLPSYFSSTSTYGRKYLQPFQLESRLQRDIWQHILFFYRSGFTVIEIKHISKTLSGIGMLGIEWATTSEEFRYIVLNHIYEGLMFQSPTPHDVAELFHGLSMMGFKMEYWERDWRATSGNNDDDNDNVVDDINNEDEKKNKGETRRRGSIGHSDSSRSSNINTIPTTVSLDSVYILFQTALMERMKTMQMNDLSTALYA